MKFDLKTPCNNCPFRSDVRPYISSARATEILTSLFVHDQSFPCHKTVEYDDESDGVITADSQHCAGAMIHMEKIGFANQVMRIAERLGIYDRNNLNMDAPVYPDRLAMIRAHRRGKSA